jgi:hypothetical protein
MPRKLLLLILVLFFILLVAILLILQKFKYPYSDKNSILTINSAPPTSIFNDLSKTSEYNKEIEADDYKVTPVYPLKTNVATTTMAKILGGDPDKPEPIEETQKVEPETSYYDRLEELGLIWGSIVSWDTPNYIRIRLNTEQGSGNVTEHTFQCGSDTAFFDGRNNIQLIDSGFDFVTRLRKKSMIYASCANESCTQLQGPCIVVWN